MEDFLFTVRNLSLITCVLATACSSSEPAPHEQPDATIPAAALQQALEETVASDVAPGVAVVVTMPNGAPWSGAAGVADLESGQAITPTHRFRAGSILKTFVATATLQLVEQNRRSLDETLPQLLPVAVTSKIANADRITLRMLLDHTSGIPDWAEGAEFDVIAIGDPVHRWTVEEELARIATRPASFQPGAGWAYSNTDYTLLGEVLSATTGQPWRQVIAERVIARARLKDTTLPAVGDLACSGCAHGYEYAENMPEAAPKDATLFDSSMAGAAGGAALITTAADLATFLRALMKGQLFDDPRTLEAMLTFADAPLPEELQVGYGLGVIRDQREDTVMLGHLGGTAGFQSFMLYMPQSELVLTGFMNRRGDLRSFLLPIMELASQVR